MTDGPAPPTPCPWLAAAFLVVLGGVAVHLLGAPPPDSPGAARLASPEILLAVFDTLWLLAAAGPWRVGALDRGVTLVVGAPFHLVIAAPAGAGPAHLVATAMIVLGFAAAAGAARGRSPGVHAALLALLTFAIPVVAYALAEFAGVGANALFRASPLTAPTLLARTAPTAAAADAVPALVAAALLVAVATVVRRRAPEMAR